MTKKAIYSSAWRSARAAFLSRHRDCARCGKPANVVDHITPHNSDSLLFWDKTNWQPLCKNCHDSHKQRLEKSGSIIGCNRSGIPTDPKHHWNK